MDCLRLKMIIKENVVEIETKQMRISEPLIHLLITTGKRLRSKMEIES